MIIGLSILGVYVFGFAATHIGIVRASAYHDGLVGGRADYNRDLWEDEMGRWLLPCIWPIAVPCLALYALSKRLSKSAELAGDRERVRRLEIEAAEAELTNELAAYRRRKG
jgi:hypothetical protein